MTRVFLNLFGNGFYATAKRQRDGAGPDFRPTLKVATRDLGDAVEVRVRDNGTGIAPEIRDKLFQPFVTTKPTGEGTGLGLSISYDIVTQQHGGTIEVDSRVGEFTEFTIRLPRAPLGQDCFVAPLLAMTRLLLSLRAQRSNLTGAGADLRLSWGCAPSSRRGRRRALDMRSEPIAANAAARATVQTVTPELRPSSNSEPSGRLT